MTHETPKPGEDEARPLQAEDALRWDEAEACALLEALCHRHQVAVEALALKKAWRETTPSASDPWEQMRQAATQLGLRLVPTPLTPAEAARLVQPDSPLVLRAREGWWLVHEGGSEALRLGRPPRSAVTDDGQRPQHEVRWVPFSALPLSDDDAPDFALAQAALPASDVAYYGDKPNPWRRLLALLRPERRDLKAVLLFAIAVGVLNLATPVAVEALVNTVAFGGLLQPVIVLSLALMICLALGGALYALQAYVTELLQRRVFVRLVADLAYRLPRIELASIDKKHGPELVNRFFDVVNIQKTLAKLMLDGLTAVLSATLGLIVLAFYHPALLAFDMLLLAALLVILFGLGRRGVGTALDESEAKYRVADWLQELTRHPFSFRLQGGRELAQDRADALAGTYLRRRADHYRVVLRQLLGAIGLQVLASTALLLLGGWLVEIGQLSLGQLVASWLIVSLVVAAITKLGGQVESVYDLLTGVAKVGKLVDLPLERDGGEVVPRGSGPASLSLAQVAFRFPQSHSINGNFTIEPGEHVALVGPSGSGKSTLLELIRGLRTPQAGRIEIDGVDVRALRLESMREQVALARGGETIAGTIAENLRMGRQGHTLQDLREALEAVELWRVVQALPKGLDTKLTSIGKPLSTGQAQRLVLARTLLGQPRLLLVDGALDAVDPETRARITERLCAPDTPWTLLLVTHCEPSIAACQRRVEMPAPPALTEA